MAASTDTRRVVVGSGGFLAWYGVVWGIGMAALSLEWLNDVGTNWSRVMQFVGLTIPLMAGGVVALYRTPRHQVDVMAGPCNSTVYRAGGNSGHSEPKRPSNDAA
jgi:hypothetical protein